MWSQTLNTHFISLFCGRFCRVQGFFSVVGFSFSPRRDDLFYIIFFSVRIKSHTSVPFVRTESAEKAFGWRSFGFRSSWIETRNLEFIIILRLPPLLCRKPFKLCIKNIPILFIWILVLSIRNSETWRVSCSLAQSKYYSSLSLSSPPRSQLNDREQSSHRLDTECNDLLMESGHRGSRLHREPRQRFKKKKQNCPECECASESVQMSRIFFCTSHVNCYTRIHFYRTTTATNWTVYRPMFAWWFLNEEYFQLFKRI